MNFLRKLSQLIFLFVFIFLISLSHHNSTFMKKFIFIDYNLLAILYRFFVLKLAIFPIFIFLFLIFLFLGRAFCGWICPLGTFFDIINKILQSPFTPLKWAVKGRRNQRLKFNLLLFFLILLIFSIPIIWIFDPMTLSLKIFSTSILPVAKFSIYKVLELLSKFPLTQNVAGNLFNYLNEFIVLDKINACPNSFLFLIILITLGISNYFFPRIWCKIFCPLGATLGLFAKIGIFKIKISPDCINCKKCEKICPMSAIKPLPMPLQAMRPSCQSLAISNPTKILPEECILCGRCVTICPTKAISYKFFGLSAKHKARPKFVPKSKPDKLQEKEKKVLDDSQHFRTDLKENERSKSPSTYSIKRGLRGITRREFLISISAGFLSLPILKFYQKEHKKPINFLRPPGSCKEDEFISRCIKCGKCIAICPTNGLQPSLFESGIIGIWTPHLVPRIGSCQYNCNLCGQVCPTSAIKNLPLEKKRYTKIGTAIINRDLCLWWRGKSECQICEEFCPYPDKAIKIITETRIINGKKEIKRGPIVKEELCLGCGICENLCPVKESPAIYVVNIGEKRL